MRHGGVAPPVWGVAQHIERLQKLLEPTVIGLYRSFEVTELLGFHADSPKTPVNFFSLLVAEAVAAPSETGFSFLAKRLKLRDTPWSFGVARYRISPDQLLDALRALDSSSEWSPKGVSLGIGELAAIPPQFVPSDGIDPHPWNSLLKNNFWEGSHLLELFDRTKIDVQFLLKEPRHLRRLAEYVRPIAKMSIDGLSDRLGNIVIQLPVTVITSVVNSRDEDGAYGVQPVWHPDVNPRVLRISCEKYEDSVIEGFDSKDVIEGMARFSVTAPGEGPRYVMWDDTNKLILGASAKTFFFTSFGIHFNSSTLGSNVRKFSIPSKQGELEETWIPITTAPHSSEIGSSPFKPHEPWRSRRIFSNSLHELKERKEFVQYGGQSGANREQAIKDIRFLFRVHGQHGAWLWDPYLDADDILETLFYNEHANSDLRALSAGKPLPTCKCEKGDIDADSTWKNDQHERLEDAKGNENGLSLEFRVRKGHAGWDFHDRFLIFPSATGGAIAWSLGTSINSLGRKHHILQKVQDGELIRQAFLDLWEALDSDEYLVWKSK
ncbi:MULTISPECIES: VPA1262 family N-terminal domain-containing protein [unclassified Herbaspirillum]|uniref:VPA1262 family N-terminal domain-containing protein n=1 Tax=unclassified Herbaspirillum TaxID=2624150 RepID=UPI001151A43D|nr:MULTISPECIES: VPA1262 family N-terminal domain-containing protein [unclassified Herbaspirillum]MBB5392778.1 hypothetical protein [Herbaspirillum sp. SJZ102]TQK04574.1 hypothetical protein FB599_3138 [Herbaspirillum sp. SJZ130]TQK09640.1 hypothetical protein FB598_2623 [Herbaspirillum sp. SJZ106]